MVAVPRYSSSPVKVTEQEYRCPTVPPNAFSASTAPVTVHAFGPPDAVSRENLAVLGARSFSLTRVWQAIFASHSSG